MRWSVILAEPIIGVLLLTVALQILTNSRPFVPDDWIRFELYARRIYVLNCTPYNWEDSPRYARGVERTLRAIKGAPLLPNLRSATAQMPVAEPTDSLSLITSVSPSSLMAIGSVCCPTAEDSPDALLTVARHFLAIQDANFLLGSDISAALRILAGAVERWCELRRLSVCIRSNFGPVFFPSDELVNALSALTKLNEFRIDVNMRRDRLRFIARIILPNRPLAFHSLLWQDLSAYKPDFVQSILDDVSLQSLNELSVVTTSFAVYPTFLAILSRCALSRTLQRLDITTYSAWVIPEEPMVVTAAHLAPLTHLHRLRHLSFTLESAGGRFDVGDDEWATLAASWPALEQLAIKDAAQVRFAENIRATSQTLVHFARSCPRLSSITLALLNTPDASSQVERDTLPVHDRLQRLQLHIPGIDDLDFFASFLVRMFPRLTEITRMTLMKSKTLSFREDFEEHDWEEMMQSLRRYRASNITTGSDVPSHHAISHALPLRTLA